MLCVLYIMSWKIRLLILTVVITSTVGHSETQTIYVNPDDGQDSEDCLANHSVSCNYATVRYAFSKVDNSTNANVLLADLVHKVNGTIIIVDISQLSLTSVNSNSIIHCSQGSNAGLRFERVSNIVISRIQFQNCGSLSQSTSRIGLKTLAMFRVAVYVINTTNITFESVNVVNNRGVGIALFDVNGYVYILNSTFINNTVPKEEILIYNGGGGLYIEHTYCTPGLLHCDYYNNPYSNDSMYSISGCTFANNHATTPPKHSSSIFTYQEKTTSRHFGAGGGLLIVLKGNSHGNRIIIADCSFKHNSAGYGGASLINVQDFVRANVISFVNCTVVNNHADFGGGGITTGILFYEVDSVFANEINFYEVDFYNNSSPTGGGSYIFIGRTKNSELTQNSVYFSSCQWCFNNATLGAAILLSPDAFNTLTDGYLPIPVFEDCVFKRNQIVPLRAESNLKQPAVGVLFSSTFTINISSNVTFVENDGTALSITAGSINILENAVLEFKKNTGIRGGALALLEFSSLRLTPGSHVRFIDNYASEVGGAIYAAAQDELDFHFSRSCFIHYEDVTIPAKDWRVSVEFINNYAGPQSLNSSQDARGNSVYSVTILPCLLSSDTTGERNISNAFPYKSGDPFTFIETCQGEFCGIATAPTILEVSPDQLDSDGMLKLSPGERHKLDIVAKDDLGKRISAVITASASPKEIATIDSASLFITDGIIQVNGKVGSKFSITFQTTGRKKVSLSLKAIFAECPSGFVYDTDVQKCVCSATVPNKQYLGIIRCDTGRFESYQTKGYWAGCDKNGALLTAKCPLGYCRADENTTFNTNRLPKTCEGLDTVICGARNRSGLLCGECIPNHTIFFHSEQYNCQKCKLGNIGWLFYILSELLPVTLVFLTVVLFNVHLTSGMWNGIILYAQVTDVIEASSLLSSNPSHGISTLTSGYRFMYAMFNLDFFKFKDTFSFCLWNGATVMDGLIFRYLTSAYAFLLLLILIFSFKSQCCQGSWERGQAIIKRSHHTDWIVHGISAFLVLSYAQCVKVSFQILSAVQLHGEGLLPIKTVSVLSGNVEYLSPEHLPYALPAIFVLTVTTLPLILLIMYPNGLQIITACFGEKTVDKVQQCCSLLTCRCFQKTIQITRFKPLYDSFQGCFKDKFRIFAGLFFFYRFTASLISAVSLNTIYLYTSIEVMTIVMLALHAWAQPYEQKFYNIVDTFMYANFAVVNGLNVFNIYWANNPTNSNHSIVNEIMSIQVILIYLPLIYFFVMWFLLGLTACSKKARRQFRKINEYIPLFKPSPEEMDDITNVVNIAFDENTLPHRMFDDSHLETNLQNIRSTN